MEVRGLVVLDQSIAPWSIGIRCFKTGSPTDLGLTGGGGITSQEAPFQCKRNRDDPTTWAWDIRELLKLFIAISLALLVQKSELGYCDF